MQDKEGSFLENEKLYRKKFSTKHILRVVDMKRFLLKALFVFIGFLAFAQERIAVFPFEDRSNVYTKDELDSFYVEFSNEFRNKTDDRKFTVLTRKDLENLINMEARFQLSDYSSKEKTAELQRVLNAQQVLYCLILKVGNEIRITVSRYIFPELSVLRGGKTISVTNKNQLFGKIPELVQSMVNEIAVGSENISGNTSTEKIYNIGDTGPAGGIVFFDRGFIGDGWRYLEAAPATAEFAIEFEGGKSSKFINKTATFIGSGKQNTKYLLQLNNTTTNQVIYLNALLDINGYKDWFIPSKAELDIIYKNLKEKGLSEFRESIYLSSSFTDDSSLWTQSFINGYQSTNLPIKWKYVVRAVRAF
jgi:hypothetical protein